MVDEEKPDDFICQPYLVKFIKPLDNEDLFEHLVDEDMVKEVD
jgi:hypothetical protein